MSTTVIRRELNERSIKVWPLLVVKIIIDMLVNGTSLSAVSKKMESTVRLTCPSTFIEELPNVDCTRKVRGIVRIMSETAAA